MSEPDPVPDLPEPSPYLILILALVQAHCRTLSRKDRNSFLLDVTEALGVQEASYNVLKFRPRAEDRAVYKAMREAQAWWRQIIGMLTRVD